MNYETKNIVMDKEFLQLQAELTNRWAQGEDIFPEYSHNFQYPKEKDFFCSKKEWPALKEIISEICKIFMKKRSKKL